ncbi:hypothetical protein ABZ816_40520 [Actinosynnema sp. NPDC047251]|uniref:Uncharacterized protein n=1 Tax=Saccharothrix espanaensis (strain ATCC 51144 / DSM 44229 / JCM 9112 / NBRC 15066 / NRRL 15764) TaxID=1179773 RepID=K0JYT4_SACES|nr:hypothetical protein [Saccharothrix espanaensis]CCH29864.1 hypothetical protein BN6_25500 [Saccharothrix espanaensis DSM 44229]
MDRPGVLAGRADHIAAHPADELERARIEEMFARYQEMWARRTERWLELRRISDR